MAISIRAAHSNVMSERYNKKNVVIFIVSLTIASIFSALCTKNTVPGIMAAAILINLLVILISAGITPLAIYNKFNEKENVFPSVISDIKDILLTALKNIAGAIIVSIIAGCVFGLISILVLKIKIIGIIILIALSVFYLLLVISLYSQFISKLDFKDWFNFKNALNLIKNNYKSFCIYILKNLIVYILACIPVIILIIVISAFLTALSHGNSQATSMTTSILSGIIGSVIGTYLTLYVIDLTGQFLKEIMQKAE